MLAAVFAIAGATKLCDLAGSRRAVAEFGVPERLAPLAGSILPLLELAVAVALIPTSSARSGAIGAAVLLAAFAAGIVNALAHGAAPDCHCFGQVHSAPAGWRTLARDGVLGAMAVFVVIADRRSGGLSATHWVTAAPTAVLIAVPAGVVIVGLMAFQLWFCLQLLAQNGRTVARLEALEQALAAGPEAEVVPSFAEGLRGGGLAVGESAPEFSLPGLYGETHTLASLLAPRRRLLLVFSDPRCGPCTQLAPLLSRWQGEHEAVMTVAVISTGEVGDNRAKAAEHGLQRVMLQAKREVADAFQAHGTPVAVVVSPDGRIESPAIGGVKAIETLVERAIGRSRRQVAPEIEPARVEPDVPVPAAARSSRPRARSRVGAAAPELELRDLDGRQVALGEHYHRHTLILFWNPGCGFCQRMLPALKELESLAAGSRPEIVVISTGDVERNRVQEIRSLLLLDPDGVAKQAFGAGGTPMGVLVEYGKIASEVAAGADAVLELVAQWPALDVIPAATATNGRSSPRRRT